MDVAEVAEDDKLKLLPLIVLALVEATPVVVLIPVKVAPAVLTLKLLPRMLTPVE